MFSQDVVTSWSVWKTVVDIDVIVKSYIVLSAGMWLPLVLAMIAHALLRHDTMVKGNEEQEEDSSTEQEGEPLVEEARRIPATILTDLVSESDAYKILFEEIYKPKSDTIKFNFFRVYRASFTISVQLSAIVLIATSFHGLSEADDAWEPVLLDPDDPFLLGARCFGFYLAIILTTKEYSRNNTLFLIASRHSGSMIGNLCAWMIVFISWCSVLMTLYVSAGLIVHCETLVDVMKDFAALTFVLEIDDMAAFGNPVDQTQWENSVRNAPKPKLLMKVLNITLGIVRWCFVAYLLAVWIPVNSIAHDDE